MKSIWLLTATLAGGLALAGCNGNPGQSKAETAATGDVVTASSNPTVGGAEMLPTKTIVENASASPIHKTLVAALKQADLVELGEHFVSQFVELRCVCHIQALGECRGELGSRETRVLTTSLIERERQGFQVMGVARCSIEHHGFIPPAFEQKIAIGHGVIRAINSADSRDC